MAYHLHSLQQCMRFLLFFILISSWCSVFIVLDFGHYSRDGLSLLHFEFPFSWWHMIWASFHVLICHLYILFCELYFLTRLFGFKTVEVWEFFIYSRYYSFAGYVFCKDSLRACSIALLSSPQGIMQSKFLSLRSSNLSNFHFMVCAFDTKFENSFPSFRKSWRYPPVMFSKSFMF